MTYDPAKALDDVIRLLRSQSELARRLGLRQPQVAKWKRKGRIPMARVPAVSRLTGIPAYQLRPDLPEFFPPPADDMSPQQQRAECLA